MPSLRRLAVPATLLELTGVLEGVEVLRQRRHGTGRSLVTSGSDRDLTSVRLLALTWWPAGIGALAAAAWLPRLDIGERRRTRCVLAGMAVTVADPAGLPQRRAAHSHQRSRQRDRRV